MSELQFYIIKDTSKPSKWIALATVPLMIISVRYFYSIALFYVFFTLFVLSCINLFFIRTWQKSDVTDEYHRMFVEYTEDLESEKQSEKQSIKSATHNELPEYIGKDKFRVYRKFVHILYPIIYIIFAFRILLEIEMYYLYEQGGSSNTIGISLIGALVLVFICILIILNKKVYISYAGVRLVNRAKNIDQLFRWNEIQTIGIGKNGKDSTAGNKFIYISTKRLKYRPTISSCYSDKSTIVMRYNNAAIHCILKYYDKKIHNVYDLKSWQRYIDKTME